MSFDPKQPPDLSIIIPVHNGAAFLRACLDAIFASEYASYECIVVNDGSTDGSAAIAREFAARVLDLPEGPRGPAYARNRGAQAAHGAILMFVDADVVLAAGALERVANAFRERSGVAALFGSYDAQPAAPGAISQYRNLLHHFVHQNGNPEASTFWAGCGAIRRSVFAANRGFDEVQFLRPSIEDIELGYRLRAAGYRIRLDKGLQGTHLKQWNLYSLIYTDVVCRALPWSRLIIETKNLPDDLNLKMNQRASFILAALACVFLLLSVIYPPSIVLSAAALLGVVALNRKLYRFFYRSRGARFAAACIALQVLYYLYSGLSYLYAWVEFQLRGRTAMRSIAALKSAARSILGAKL